MKMFKHEKSGHMLAKELAQPHVESFHDIFTDWEPHQWNQKASFEPQRITGQNIAGNLFKNVEQIMRGTSKNERREKWPDEVMTISTFCSYREGHAFNVRAADWVSSRIRERTIIIGGDTMSFELINRGDGWTLATTHHSQILGTVWLAYIKTETIPQLKEFVFNFTGRKVGAIGEFIRVKNHRIYAEDVEKAKLLIYKTHEHISKLEVQAEEPATV